MFSLSSLLIASAYAADAAEAVPPTGDAGSVLIRYMPVFLIFAVFYFVLIRPQQKKFDEQSAMITALKKGDKVVILGGLLGTIAKLDGDDKLVIDLGTGAQIRVLRNAVTALDTPPANDDKVVAKKDKTETTKA
jgi:preprotein translocase subunit YajC